ncbi:hypothetical protein B0H66DRAFT_522146 [Apodospora peruviana]|uniref:FAD-binding PCMH-type domain-containing protein n=1 Tax=Apodospora peruviana TaxID=516989 RepID=A0AAE0HZ75_9PEZI|nr:hypothetical protein B0H66DRAFT_522146 [Apodospora peruviana]
MMRTSYLLGFLLPHAIDAAALNFAYETTQLTAQEAGNFSAISFGNFTSSYQKPRCKVQPEDAAWPSEAQWARLNATVGGHLLKPQPVGAACYPDRPEYNNATCAYLLGPATATRFFFNDPLTALTTWGEGATCLQLRNTTGRTCTQGGFPVYVVNATSVRDIQAAVNFARNQNLRLVIKNTGHDFIAKSSGKGALSVWTHNLKGIEFLSEYTVGEYKGAAARISAGLEAWEIHNAMVEAGNVTVVTSLEATVGNGGGWALGGGHGPLTSLYGLGADQILSLNVITADGRFLTADMNQNQDLYFALRGGGGGTFGIVTSMVVKAWPKETRIGGLTFYLTTGPGAVTIPSARGYPPPPPLHVADTETFWKAYRIYLGFTKQIVDAGGFGFGDVNPQGNKTFVLVGTMMLPDYPPDKIRDFYTPLFESFREIGVNIPNPRHAYLPYAQRGTGITPTSFPGSPADLLFISRLLPRSLWDDTAVGNGTTSRLDGVSTVNRQNAEMGYRVTLRAYGPTAQAAGYPGNTTSAVNPAMRNMVIHCVTFKQEPVDVLPPDQFAAEHAKLRGRINELVRLTPESGSYFNEADILEPDWRTSFWGEHYPRLLSIKKAVDRWGLFWAPTTVGSDEWRVVTAQGLPTQNGPLCRAD